MRISDWSSDVCSSDLLKEVIKTGGFLVAPLELEAVLVTHPAVAEACVIAAPDARLGEVGVAAVQLRPGACCTEAELIELCRARQSGRASCRQGCVSTCGSRWGPSL